MSNSEKEPAVPPVRKKRVKRITTFNEEFDLTLFLLIARKQAKWIAGIFALAILITILYLRYSDHIYEESTTIQIGSANTANKVLEGSNALYQNAGEDELEEAIELMGSRLFLEGVFKSLPMQISYYTEGTFMNHELYPNPPYTVEADSTALLNLNEVKIYIHLNSASSGQISYTIDGKTTTQAFTANNWFTIPQGKLKIHIIDYNSVDVLQNKLKKDACFFCINNYSQLAERYSPLISIKLLNPEAKTLQISCRDYSNQKACDIVNTIAREYIKFDVEKRRESAESVLNFINDQLDVVYGRIKLTENTLDTFHHKNDVSGPTPQMLAASETRYSSIEDQIAATDLELKLMQDIQNQLNSKKEIDATELLTLINESDYASSLRDNLGGLQQLITQKREALNTITPDNPSIIQIDKLIVTEKKVILQAIADIINKIETKMQALKNQSDKLIAPLRKISADSNMEYLRLQRLFSIDEKYYDLLLAKKAEYEISKAGFVAQSQVLENALPVWVVVSPKKSASFAVSMLAAMIISIIMLLVMYLFYNTLSSVEEIERLSESPVSILGIVPLYTRIIPASQLIVNYNPKSILAESFRSIRTNLQFISANTDETKIIAVTSTISGEGKTFVSINLAGIIAYSGKKVIILDLDMRKPRIHTALGLDNSKGMSTLLIGKYKVEDVIQKTETDNLFVITAGPIPPNPSELLISKPMDDLLELLKKTYDVIIIDNPPVGLVTDSIAMLQRADYPIYVMRTNYSKREFIHFVDRLYYENQLTKLSIVLNGVDLKRQPYGYGYYGYGHTYGQGNYYEA